MIQVIQPTFNPDVDYQLLAIILHSSQNVHWTPVAVFSNYAGFSIVQELLFQYYAYNCKKTNNQGKLCFIENTLNIIIKLNLKYTTTEVNQ